MHSDTNTHQNIPIDKIKLPQQSVREEIDYDHISELALSIAAHGLLQPIIVSRDNDDSYILVAGRHRLEACKRLAWTVIPAIVIDAADKAKVLSGIENIARLQMTPREEALLVQSLHENDKLSINQICDLLCKSRDWVLRRLAYFQFPIDIVEALDEKRISYGHAEHIAKIDDTGLRQYILNVVLQQKLTISQTRQLVEYYLQTMPDKEVIEEAIQRATETRTIHAKTTKTCPICKGTYELKDIAWVEICTHCLNTLHTTNNNAKGDQ